jgi:CheY-like chemotaxis protein
MSSSSAALLIASQASAMSISDVLGGAGIDCAIAFDGQQAWRLLASKRPGIVFVEAGVDGVDEFHRRLRDEFMGTPPRILGLIESGEVDAAFAHVELAAALVKPASPQALLGAASPAGHSRPTTLDPSRLREMLKLTTLGPELQGSLDALARRLLLLYGANDCIVLVTSNEKQYVGSVGESVPGEGWPTLWQDWAQAADTVAPRVVTNNAQSDAGIVAHGGAVETRFAVRRARRWPTWACASARRSAGARCTSASPPSATNCARAPCSIR